MTATASQTVCALGLLLALSAAAPAAAQDGSGDSGVEAAEMDPLVHGFTIGGGLVFYQGDLDVNPRNNYLKFIGSSRLSLFARADRRYDPFTVGLEVSYNYLAGRRQFGERVPYSFTNNVIGLDVTGSVDLGFPRADMLRLFLSAGPSFFLSPNYDGFLESKALDEFQDEEEFRNFGTRVRPGFAIGFSVQEAVRVGFKAFTTDYVDGFSGVSSPFDSIVFVNVTYRFDLTR